VLTYRNFVAHAFEALDELGRGTCLLRQLLQIVRELRLQIIRKIQKIIPEDNDISVKIKMKNRAGMQCAVIKVYGFGYGFFYGNF